MRRIFREGLSPKQKIAYLAAALAVPLVFIGSLNPSADPLPTTDGVIPVAVPEPPQHNQDGGLETSTPRPVNSVPVGTPDLTQ